MHSDGSWTEEGNGDRVMLLFGDKGNRSGTASLDSLETMNRNLYFNAVGEAQFSVEDKILSLDEWKNYDGNVMGSSCPGCRFRTFD